MISKDRERKRVREIEEKNVIKGSYHSFIFLVILWLNCMLLKMVEYLILIH